MRLASRRAIKALKEGKRLTSGYNPTKLMKTIRRIHSNSDWSISRQTTGKL